MMEINLKPGRYLVAVSGGVDSIALLDLLHRNNYDIVVAHFNHGIRDDSNLDEEVVRDYCLDHKLSFVSSKGNLGVDASEAKSRDARYSFLREEKRNNECVAIVTAHHSDDLLETAIINIIRGTNRRGLSSLKDTDEIKRPLLNYSKQELIDYAKKHNLTWREDESNQDNTFLRNYVRNILIPQAQKADPDFKRQLYLHIENTKEINEEADKLIETLSEQVVDGDSIDRDSFRDLPEEIKKEIVREKLGTLEGTVNISADHINSIVVFIDEKNSGKIYDLSKDWQVVLSKKEAKFTRK